MSVSNIVVAAISLIFGTILGVLLAGLPALPTDFLDFKLIDIINVLTVLAVGSFIGYQANRRLSNDNKLRGIILLQVERYEEKIEELHALAEQHANSNSDESARRESAENIVARFKVASATLGTLCQTLEHCKKKINCGMSEEKLRNGLLEYKASATDEFLRSTQYNSSVLLNAVRDKREKIINMVIQLKINLYS